MSRLTIVLIALLALGCAKRQFTEEGTHPPVRGDSPDTTVRWDSASLVDDSIADKIAVEQVTAEPTTTGTLTVTALIRNRTDYGQQVEMRTSFFDQAKVPVEKPTAWQRVVLSPNTFETYRCSSTSSGAVHYYVEIREGR